MNEDLFETFKCSGCGAPVRSKYKAAPGKTLVYFCDPCGVKAYAARMNRPPVDRTPPEPVK